MTYALGAVRPHVRAAAESVGPKFGIKTIYGIGLRPSGNSDHPRGLALDFMTFADMANGERLAAYLLTNSKALAIKYVIWNQRIWQGKGWKAMENRGSPTANHKDHVHVSFEADASNGLAPEKDSGGIDLPGIPGIEAVTDPLKEVADTAAALGKVLIWPTKPENILRAGFVLAGLLLLGYALINIDKIKGAVSGATGAATGVANTVGKVKA